MPKTPPRPWHANTRRSTSYGRFAFRQESTRPTSRPRLKTARSSCACRRQRPPRRARSTSVRPEVAAAREARANESKGLHNPPVRSRLGWARAFALCPAAALMACSAHGKLDLGSSLPGAVGDAAPTDSSMQTDGTTADQATSAIVEASSDAGPDAAAADVPLDATDAAEGGESNEGAIDGPPT